MGIDAFDLFKSGYNSIIYDDDSVIRGYFSKLRDVSKMTGQQLMNAGKITARKVVAGQYGISEDISFVADNNSSNTHRRKYERLGSKRHKKPFRN